MKKILVFLILCFPLISAAKDTNHVWLPFTGGNFEQLCRKIWDLYDAQYHTTTTITVKPGASGEIAARDMMDSPARNRAICAGVTMIVYNQYMFPGSRAHGDQLEMIVRAVTLPKVWYVPNRTPAVRNLNEYVTYLKSLNRPINVGYFHGADRLMIQYLSRTYGVDMNMVMHKSGPQMYPSLADGSLDLALDGGTGVRVAEEGRFRVLAYVGRDTITPLRGYMNFGAQDKGLAEIDGWFGIAVPRDLDPASKSQLAQRMATIVRQESFRTFADSVVSSADGLTGPALSEVIRRNRITADRYWQ